MKTQWLFFFFIFLATVFVYADDRWYPIKISITSSSNANFPYKNIIGLDLGIFGATTKKVSGLQIAALTLKTGESFNGVQVSSLLAINNSCNGLQVSSFSKSRIVRGVQVGLFTSAQHVYGAQIGLFNSCEILEGVQIGFLNSILNEGGEPIKVWPLINVGW
mgnify:CR=1 FL=1